jgi:5'-methylthioadenosine phosphorylase
VIGHLLANAETAKKVLQRVIPQMPREANWPEHRALENAIITDRKLWPAATTKKLGPIIERFL